MLRINGYVRTGSSITPRAPMSVLCSCPEVPLDAITSPEYQVWRIKHGYSRIRSNTNSITFFLESNRMPSCGCSKERLFVENLCEIPIPVLSDKPKFAIVDRWGAAESEIASANER